MEIQILAMAIKTRVRTWAAPGKGFTRVPIRNSGYLIPDFLNPGPGKIRAGLLIQVSGPGPGPDPQNNPGTRARQI